MGTMWEDLGADAVFALMNTQGEIDMTKSSMESLSNDAYDNLGTAFQGIGATIETDLLMPLSEETLNKGAGIDNYLKGNYYAVDTSRINHQDIFNISQAVSNLISSGTFCVDEIREKLGEPPLNTDWSKKHFITKNFEEMQRFLNSPKGGEE